MEEISQRFGRQLSKLDDYRAGVASPGAMILSKGDIGVPPPPECTATTIGANSGAGGPEWPNQKARRTPLEKIA